MKNSSDRFLAGKSVAREVVGDGISRQMLGYDPTLMMTRAWFDAGSIGYVHHHPHAQVTYVESGEFEVEIDGEVRVMTAGDAFHVPPNISHGAVCRRPGTLIDVFSPMREDFFETEKP